MALQKSSERLTASSGKENVLGSGSRLLCLIPEITQPGMLNVIKPPSRHHLPRGVPWLLCSCQRDAIASIRHSSLSTSTSDSLAAAYLSDCSWAQLNTVMEHNTVPISAAACHSSLTQGAAFNKLV